MVVESAFEERVVGVPDPEDDCLVIWDLIKANEPPKQIVEGGEYFVLKTDKAPAWTEIPESAPPAEICWSGMLHGSAWNELSAFRARNIV